MKKLNEKLFDSIYKKYYNRILEYCRKRIKDKAEAISAANDSFILLYQKWEKLDFTDCPDKLLVWLHKTANLKIKEYYSKKQKNSIIDSIDSYENTLYDDEEDILTDFFNEEKKYNCIINELKSKLPPSEFEIFELLVLKEKKQADAASQIGISTEALKMRWYRLKPKIVKLMKQISKSLKF